MPKIWIADDDEAIRWVLEKGLTERGITVQTFDVRMIFPFSKNMVAQFCTNP